MGSIITGKKFMTDNTQAYNRVAAEESIAALAKETGQGFHQIVMSKEDAAELRVFATEEKASQEYAEAHPAILATGPLKGWHYV